LVHELLRREGLPVPAHAEFRLGRLDEALTFLAEHAPCVVKPASGTDRGTGVTGGIRTPSDLARGQLVAARWDSRLLIEGQVAGDVYRLLVLDGTLVGAVRRRRPSVVGDGRSTIAELIEAENRQRAASLGDGGLSRLEIDLDMALALRASGLSVRSIPGAGDRIEVKTVANQNRVDDNETVDDVHEELADEAAAAVRAVGLRLGGVDILAPTHRQSLATSGGVILEVNGTPGFNQHYHVADAERATRVAVPVLRALLGG
jgi:D-alanine-D-alanine ligase-like ATP-grasp enzyme